MDCFVKENDNIKDRAQEVMSHSLHWLNMPFSMAKFLEKPKDTKKEGETLAKTTVKKEKVQTAKEGPSSSAPIAKKKEKGEPTKEVGKKKKGV